VSHVIFFLRAFTNKFYKHYDSGVYTCLVCSEDLFNSETKYESGSGWPSFYDVVAKDKISTRADASGSKSQNLDFRIFKIKFLF
jgi:peptide methionine sulfoxide reductase MsrB